PYVETFFSRADCSIVSRSLPARRHGPRKARAAVSRSSVRDENVILHLGDARRGPGGRYSFVVIGPGADRPTERDRPVGALHCDALRVQLRVPLHRLLDRVLDVVRGRSGRDELDVVLDSHDAEEVACDVLSLVALVLPVRLSGELDNAVVDLRVDCRG